MKKRLISSNNENINNKIKEVMRKKCEKINNNNLFINKKFNIKESLSSSSSNLLNINNNNNNNKFNEMFNRNNLKEQKNISNDFYDKFNLQLNEYDDNNNNNN